METIRVSHADLSYDQKDISNFKNFDWYKATKADAVSFARAAGYRETGMSVNEVALLFDLLEQKKPRKIVELGRNFGTSTRIFLQYAVRHGAFLESWDSKHWGNLKESFGMLGFKLEDLHDVPDDSDYLIKDTVDLGLKERVLADIRIADSVMSDIVPQEKWVDFLLIDTEHGLEHAVGEYMRWRNFMNGESMIAFHDSTLPAVARSIEIIKEIEWSCDKEFGRFRREYILDRQDGFGIQVLELR